VFNSDVVSEFSDLAFQLCTIVDVIEASDYIPHCDVEIFCRELYLWAQRESLSDWFYLDFVG